MPPYLPRGAPSGTTTPGPVPPGPGADLATASSSRRPARVGRPARTSATMAAPATERCDAQRPTHVLPDPAGVRRTRPCPPRTLTTTSDGRAPLRSVVPPSTPPEVAPPARRTRRAERLAIELPVPGFPRARPRSPACPPASPTTLWRSRRPRPIEAPADPGRPILRRPARPHCRPPPHRRGDGALRPEGHASLSSGLSEPHSLVLSPDRPAVLTERGLRPWLGCLNGWSPRAGVAAEGHVSWQASPPPSTPPGVAAANVRPTPAARAERLLARPGQALAYRPGHDPRCPARRPAPALLVPATSMRRDRVDAFIDPAPPAPPTGRPESWPAARPRPLPVPGSRRAPEHGICRHDRRRSRSPPCPSPVRGAATAATARRAGRPSW